MIFDKRFTGNKAANIALQQGAMQLLVGDARVRQPFLPAFVL